MESVYQEINFTYNGYPIEGLNHEKNVYVSLKNDYSLVDIFDAFTEFLPCLGFGLTRTEVMEKLKEYAEENIPYEM